MPYLCQLVFPVYQILDNIEVVCTWHILQAHIKSWGLESLEKSERQTTLWSSTCCGNVLHLVFRQSSCYCQAVSTVKIHIHADIIFKGEGKLHQWKTRLKGMLSVFTSELLTSKYTSDCLRNSGESFWATATTMWQVEEDSWSWPTSLLGLFLSATSLSEKNQRGTEGT